MALSALLDGNNGSLSMTLGLGDPTTYSYLMGEAALILGRQIKEPSLYVNAGLTSPTVPVPPAIVGLPFSPGGGTGGPGDGDGGDAAGSSSDGTAGSGNNGGDNGAGDG